MCIRDSCQIIQAANTTEKVPVEDTRVTKSNTSTKRRRSSEKTAGHGPVSYTHLDVYKRQV